MSIKRTIERFFWRMSQPDFFIYVFRQNYTVCSRTEYSAEVFRLPKHLKIGFNQYQGCEDHLLQVNTHANYTTLGKAYHTAIAKYGLLECIPLKIPDTANTTILISSACAFIKETLDLLFWITVHDHKPTLFITTKCFEDTAPKQITHFVRKLLIPNAQEVPIHIVPTCKVLAPNQLKETDQFSQAALISKIETNIQLKEKVEDIMVNLNHILCEADCSANYNRDFYPYLKGILFYLDQEYYSNMYLCIRNFIMTFFTVLSPEAITQLQLLLKAIKPLLQEDSRSNIINTPSNTTIDLTYIN